MLTRVCGRWEIFTKTCLFTSIFMITKELPLKTCRVKVPHFRNKNSRKQQTKAGW